MSGLHSSLQKFAASLLLCVLAIASVNAPICPACSRIELPSSKHVALNSSDHESAPNGDKDGCSCCGFQTVIAPLGPTLALTEATSVSEFSSALPLIAPVFAIYRSPRR